MYVRKYNIAIAIEGTCWYDVRATFLDLEARKIRARFSSSDHIVVANILKLMITQLTNFSFFMLQGLPVYNAVISGRNKTSEEN